MFVVDDDDDDVGLVRFCFTENKKNFRFFPYEMRTSLYISNFCSQGKPMSCQVLLPKLKGSLTFKMSHSTSTSLFLSVPFVYLFGTNVFSK